MSAFENVTVNAETILALGNFDGLHIGHMGVLNKTLEVANERGLVPVVLLFDEHPKKVITGKRPPMIMPDEVRDDILNKMGFRVAKISFSKFRTLEPLQFLLSVYCRLNVRAICCGFNYHYGVNGSGNVETLKESCEKLGIAVFAQDEVDFEGEPISSTRIRTAIEHGNIKAVNAMLGREFSYKFEVVDGDKRGRLLGFPTINQFFPDGFVIPRFGVYASKVKLGGLWYPAVTNIGVRPTVDTAMWRSETSILGFSGDLYGQHIEVFLLDFMRDERKCSGLGELSKTISADAEKAVEIYNAMKK
ncbi:MAG: riboflavin biosynthesis protein RibF [Faecalibacterium sp.]|nr:riboflavin biosynthesis protein RibF [Ruminococcus sp.]MCM1391562.1 riboflavin biosynthesis protein RibF [Ruminococcus sp.]MCM1485119.1 riboflavin biosynthesis protein RibF [Faecalibacterium sp.]